jgi:hypothetical protein
VRRKDEWGFLLLSSVTASDSFVGFCDKLELDRLDRTRNVCHLLNTSYASMPAWRVLGTTKKFIVSAVLLRVWSCYLNGDRRRNFTGVLNSLLHLYQ